jgi:hypothetical protein
LQLSHSFTLFGSYVCAVFYYLSLSAQLDRKCLAVVDTFMQTNDSDASVPITELAYWLIEV